MTIAVADDAQYTVLSEAADILAKVLIVSVVSVVKAESGETTYTVERAAGEVRTLLDVSGQCWQECCTPDTLCTLCFCCRSAVIGKGYICADCSLNRNYLADRSRSTDQILGRSGFETSRKCAISAHWRS